MKLKQARPASEVAQSVGGKVIGNGDISVTGINEIHKVEVGDLTFVDHPKYYKKAINSAATTILINQEMESPEDTVLILVDDPFTCYNELIATERKFIPATGPISEGAEIGEGTVIQPNVFIGEEVKIGKNCLIHANVAIYDHSIIGDNVIIHSGAIIGGEAFYYQRKEQGYVKMLSCGRTIIGDNVEIGAGTTVDKGVSGDTIIGDGTKLDNLVQIGHGTVVGKNCLFAAQVGVGGKAHIGDNVILWGQVGVSKDLTIGDGAIVGAQSGVAGSLEGGKAYFGSPAREAKGAMKEMLLIRRLPEIWDKVRDVGGSSEADPTSDS
jgi:UDP-3-O-[3-hydroxymyristoyl] glucosamine N-acyltransferase